MPIKNSGARRYPLRTTWSSSLFCRRLYQMHKKKEQAVHSLQEIEQSISDIIERISVLEEKFKSLKMTMYTYDEEINDEDDVSQLSRYAKRTRKRKISIQQEIENEIVEVFVDNDTSSKITTEDVNNCMDSQIV